MPPQRVDITVPDSSMEMIKNGSLEVLKHVRKNWKSSDICFKVFTDGITNHLLGCYLPNNPEDMVLVRVYGRKTDLFIDRKNELQNMELMHSAGLAAPVYLAFNNGLAYQFVPGVVGDRKMVQEPTIYRLIAKTMAHMHTLKPLYNEEYRIPSLFPEIRKFLKLASPAFQNSLKNKRYVAAVSTIQDLYNEIDHLEDHLVQLGSPVVFCHNDLLLKNMIYNEEKGQVSFIDFEYANYNFQAFDIANHFCEFCGLESFQPELYPSQQFQKEWIRIYLEEWFCLNGHSSKRVSPKDVETMYVQVNKFALGSQLLWGTWALVQASHSTIDFDYLGYATQKIGEYFKRKEELLNLTEKEYVENEN
ncbi:ethanolamine kinase 1 [Tachypleus tridentatus]|uniref:ethanolamine kinase 1 n=1 Tax=Tachypleus tridentatus TaxID=6853 RepID=UPI003FD1B307